MVNLIIKRQLLNENVLYTLNFNITEVLSYQLPLATSTEILSNWNLLFQELSLTKRRNYFIILSP